MGFHICENLSRNESNVMNRNVTSEGSANAETSFSEIEHQREKKVVAWGIFKCEVWRKARVFMVITHIVKCTKMVRN